MKISVHNLNKKLSSQAEIWLSILKERCAIVSLEDFSTWATHQIKQHGLLSYLLLAREYPCLIVSDGAGLKTFLNQAEKNSEISWLLKDTGIFFLTDSMGLELADKWKLNAVPWSDASQRAIIKKVGIFTQTSAIKGFSLPLKQVRRKIVTYGQWPRSEQLQPPILILGPSRAGKELVAQGLYKISGRPEERFEAIGCGTISSELLLDQIFGHYKGAFTGADFDQPGNLELCEHGAIFFDDLDSAAEPLRLQSALLRYLSSEGEVRRLGYRRGAKQSSVKVNTWLLFATNKLPYEMIRNQTMREDFLNRFHRIISVPAFNRRPEDISFIAISLWKQIPDVRPLDIPALKWLRDRKSDWSGNAGEICALLVCALDIVQENKTKTLVDAFETVTARGEDYLSWYYNDDPVREVNPDPYRRLIGSTGIIITKDNKQKEAESLLSALLELMNDKGQNAIENLEEILADRPAQNPSRVQVYRFLLHLAEPNNHKHTTSHTEAQNTLNVSWATIHKITLLLPSDIIREEKMRHGKKRRIYTMQPNILK